MKPENNYRRKTLENLERDYGRQPDYNSHVVTRCHQLRKKPLELFTTEDLRIMIGQQIGLSFLIPLAIDVLTKDLFAEGDFFKGDLLKNVLAVQTAFWNENKNYWRQVNDLVKNRREEISGGAFDPTNFDKCRHGDERAGSA